MAEATGGVVEGTLPFKPGQRLNPNEVDSSAPTEQPGEQEPAPEEEVQSSRQTITREQARLCPKCGHDVRQPIDIEPTEQDKRAFVRSVMTSSRFTKTYPLFDDAIRVTFRTQIQAEIEEIVGFLRESNGTFIDLPSVQVEINKLGMVQCLAKVEIRDASPDGNYKTIEYPIVTPSTYRETSEADKGSIAAVRALRHIFKATSTPLFQSILRTYLEFTFIVDTMMLRAGSTDFWKATPSQP